MLRTIAHAKLNLTLRVLGQQDDGFHVLDSITVFCEFGDWIELSCNGVNDGFEITGPFAKEIKGDNIANLALNYFREEVSWRQPITIKIHKKIPVAAGLGGGSANAAMVLKLLNLLAPRPKINNAKMYEIALALGSDVPVCLAGRGVKMGGVGDKLNNITPLPKIPLLLVNPGVKLLSKDIFSSFPKNFSSPSPMWKTEADANDIFNTLGHKTQNDLTSTAIKLAPAVQDVLSELSNLNGTRSFGMSGSGATCFALFDPSDTVNISHAKKYLNELGWWTIQTFLRP
jgi:4-diphosphocytidyl-2-C-methyl-D-erythritol kinase